MPAAGRRQMQRIASGKIAECFIVGAAPRGHHRRNASVRMWTRHVRIWAGGRWGVARIAAFDVASPRFTSFVSFALNPKLCFASFPNSVWQTCMIAKLCFASRGVSRKTEFPRCASPTPFGNETKRDQLDKPAILAALHMRRGTAFAVPQPASYRREETPMSRQTVTLDVWCDVPAYGIVQACQWLGFERPLDVAWHHRVATCGRSGRRRASLLCSAGCSAAANQRPRCAAAVKRRRSWSCRPVTGAARDDAIRLGQCSRCRTIFWDDC